jgi:glycerol-3-phosphate dehydrogenase
LWLLNRLNNEGYKALLFEHRALGSDQTIASQGMIHGGIKYTLGGGLSGASEAIAHMPEYWRNCLRGEGDVDLRGSKVLSDHFYLWSGGHAAAKLTTFLASKVTRGRVDKVDKSTLPALLKHPSFKGSVYKLVDMVIDIPSMLQKLRDQVKEHIYLIDWQHSQFETDQQTGRKTLRIDTGGQSLAIESSALVLTAGQGNQTLLRRLGATAPVMQRRPLHQIMVKHQNPDSFYGHCLGTGTTPRLTISSHPCEDGTQVWYLGGGLAEQGVKLSASDLIVSAKKEIQDLLPWMNMDGASWATLSIDRAEPQQKNFTRPDQAYAAWASDCPNVLAAWPTKLTLVPNLGNTVLELLKDRGITSRDDPLPKLGLQKPEIALSPWQIAFEN